MKRHENLACDNLGWLARLPFLAVDDLALLTGRPASDVELILRQMDRDGHVDWITPSSPELDSTRLFVLTEPARQHFASDDRWVDEGVIALPVTRPDVLQRLTCIESTVSLNAFAANLVVTQRRNPGSEVGDFWSLPVARRRDAWWPPGVHGFSYLQPNDTAAPFFVFVDRAGAPPAHRATLVARWYRFREGNQPWGRDSVPPILVLSPGPAQEEMWTKAVLASADRRGVAPLEVVLADRSTLLDAPHAPVWRHCGHGSQSSLAKRLTWWPSPAVQPSRAALDGLPTIHELGEPRLHAWVRATAAQTHGVSTLERTAAFAVVTSSVEKRVVDCLGHHPLLTEADLAVVLRIEPRVAKLAMERALKHGLLAEFTNGDDNQQRYCLAMAALRLLAARDGVPVRRYAQHAPITALPGTGNGNLPTLLHQREHTVGANSFFISLLRGEAPSTLRLASWLNAAESAVRFESGGVRHCVRPDGSGQVQTEGRLRTFLLEWDRGTERLPVLGAKLARYAAYFSWATSGGGSSPAVLFVTTTPQREELVRRLAALTLAQFDSLFLTTCVPLLERLGPRAPIWRTSANSPRTTWPLPPSERNPMEVRP